MTSSASHTGASNTSSWLCEVQLCWEWSTLSHFIHKRTTQSEWGCGHGPCCYLVVPHADIGAHVIIDYRLLFIFRLQRHRSRTFVMQRWWTRVVLVMWRGPAPHCCCYTVNTHRMQSQQHRVCVYTGYSLQAFIMFYDIFMDEQSMYQLH